MGHKGVLRAMDAAGNWQDLDITDITLWNGYLHIEAALQVPPGACVHFKGEPTPATLHGPDGVEAANWMIRLGDGKDLFTKGEQGKVATFTIVQTVALSIVSVDLPWEDA